MSFYKEEEFRMSRDFDLKFFAMGKGTAAPVLFLSWLFNDAVSIEIT
jgi:hypothetical protein